MEQKKLSSAPAKTYVNLKGKHSIKTRKYPLRSTLIYILYSYLQRSFAMIVSTPSRFSFNLESLKEASGFSASKVSCPNLLPNIAIHTLNIEVDQKFKKG